MNAPSPFFRLAVALLVLQLVVAAQVPPKLLCCNPIDQAREVPGNLRGMIFVFDRPMAQDSHSFTLAESGDFPALAGEPEWMNEVVLVLPIKDIQPGKTYAVRLNGPRHQGFKSAEGLPLAPVTVSFSTAPAGARPRAVVGGSEPNVGATGIDPRLDRLVIHFSREVKAGRMSLVRIAGTEVLGYRKDDPPRFIDPKTLVIPVTLEAGKTYGVGVNSLKHEGFVAADDDSPVLPFQLVFSTAGAADDDTRPRPPGPPRPTGLVGDWRVSGDGLDLRMLLEEGGRYQYRSRSAEGVDETRGTWSIDGDRMTIRQDGAERALVMRYRQPEADILELEIGDDWIRLRRHEGGEPPRPEPGPGPKPEPGPTATGPAGSWRWCVGQEEMRVVLGADGRYRYEARLAEGSESATGTWRRDGEVLVISEDGAAEALRVPFKLGADDRLELVIEGERVVFDREGPAPSEKKDRAAPEPNRLPHFGAEGYILYTRYEGMKLQLEGKEIELPLPKVHLMDASGKELMKIWTVDDQVSVQDPIWAPDGQAWLCASDEGPFASALFMDIWWAPRQGKGIRRITGNSESPPAARGRGTVRLHVTDDTHDEAKAMNVAWQGGEGRFSEIGGGHSKIEGLPAGKIWVKVWSSKHHGDLQFVDVPADGVAKLDLSSSHGNRLATYPSITPDGKIIVCLSQHAWYDRKKSPPEQGYDTIAAIDVASGQLLALWDPMKNGGALAKDPRLSPDGRWIAFAMGQPGMESLTVCSLQSFLDGKPDCRVLVPGDRVLARGTTGNVAPAWSTDGRRLAFVRYFMSTQIAGNLFTIDFSGGSPTQITDLAINQCPSYPSWSADGRHIAFQLVTSRSPVLDIVDLVRHNVVSDVYLIGSTGGGLKQLTRDGRSGQPAFCPTSD